VSRLPTAEFVAAMLPSMFSKFAPVDRVATFAANGAEFDPAGFRLMAKASAEADLRDVRPAAPILSEEQRPLRSQRRRPRLRRRRTQRPTTQTPTLQETDRTDRTPTVALTARIRRSPYGQSAFYGWTGRWTPGRLAECHRVGSWSSTARTRPPFADFRAALEYEVEDPSTLISLLLTAGQIGSEAVVEYRGRRIFRGYAAIRHPEDPFDETSGIGRSRRLLFQEVPERKSGKNRLHIDVHSEPRGPR
jgi:hypothetical protein